MWLSCWGGRGEGVVGWVLGLVWRPRRLRVALLGRGLSCWSWWLLAAALLCGLVVVRFGELHRPPLLPP